MKFDFTTILDRKGHDAIAYDGVGRKKWGIEPNPPKDGYEFIPMWVADMCFATAPAVIRQMKERLNYPTFGYFEASKEYEQAIIDWHKCQHQTEILTAQDIGYENGMHGLVNSVIELLTQKGDAVLLNSPYYVAFRGDVKHKGRECIFSELYLDQDGIYRMDYEDMDRKIKKHNIHLAIFCSPHNPTGRVWTKEELERAMKVFEDNDCYVLSDEIWADLVFEEHRHIPTQQVNDWTREHVIAGYAPSKTFNLAGLIGSYHIIYNRELRERLRRYEATLSYNEMNVMSMHALIGAYSKEGAQWKDELMTVLEGNCRYAASFIKEQITGVNTSMPEGTYMMFLDCSEYCKKTGRSIEEVIKAGWDYGIGWEDGRLFGGACHIRINLALPHALEVEAFQRMKELVFV